MSLAAQEESFGAAAWRDAVLAAALFAIDPRGLKGIALKAQAGPVRDCWLEILKDLLPPEEPLRRLPLGITDDRLLGGLDLSATLSSGKPLAQAGLLADCDEGVLIAAMAERLDLSTASKIAAVLDSGQVQIARDSLFLSHPARVGLIVLDEGVEGDAPPPEALLDRTALHVDITTCALGATQRDGIDLAALREAVKAARGRLGDTRTGGNAAEAFCALSIACGIASLRAPSLALRTARAAAALEGRDETTAEDAALAARLVLAPRATQLPAPPPEEADDEPPPPEEQQADNQDNETQDPPDPSELADVILEAAMAALPPDLLRQLASGMKPRKGSRQAGGKAGAQMRALNRGRPIGARRGDLASGARLHLLETLRVAAPWQALRRTEESSENKDVRRLHIRKDDLRITRYKQRTGSTAIFVVDASGSAVLHRLAEVKGAVELLLADCYVRRDEVALVAFRGEGAEVVLPPTRSLVRAKRSLAQLAGGGGTPLAAGLETSRLLADSIARKGQTPNLVLFTDGKANIARDGQANREQAREEALAAARAVRQAGLKALVIDSSPRAQDRAKSLASEMGAHYLHLPQAKAQEVSRAVLASRQDLAPAG